MRAIRRRSFQRRRRPVEELIEKTPADGLVAGIGRVNGHLFDESRARCVVMAYDYTVLAGTQGLQNHRKKDRMFELAARTLEEGLKEKLVFDDEKKELVYNYAGVLEQMGKRKEAFEQLQQIYDADIGYKDVQARVDAYFSEQQQ